MRGAPNGFTLLEVLAASAISVIVLVAVYLMYESNQHLFLIGESLAGAQQNARVALDDIATAVRMAGMFRGDPLCRPAASGEAVRIATADTLSLHGGYRDPDPSAGPDQDCNIYVTFSLWTGAGARGTTLLKETRRAPWERGQLVEAPLAEGVTGLTFRYFDADGHSLPTAVPDPAPTACPDQLPVTRPARRYALDGQGPVAGGAVPTPVTLQSERILVRAVRVELTVETHTVGDAAAGCFRHHAGGTTQSFSAVTEAHLRGPSP